MTEYSFNKNNNLKIPVELEISKEYEEEINPDGVTLITKFISDIKRSVIDDNQSYFAVIEGHHRAGKSLWGVELAYMLDDTFTDDFSNRLVHSPTEFINAINHMAQENLHGRVILWDEAGIGLNNRDWYQKASKIIVKAIQIMGWINPIIIFITQRRHFIDTAARSFMKNIWILHRNNPFYTYVSPYIYKYNELFEQDRTISPVITIDNKSYVIKQFKVARLPHQLENLYLKVSTAWKEKTMDSMRTSLIRETNIRIAKDEVKPIGNIIREVSTDLHSFLIKQKNGTLKLNKSKIKSLYPSLSAEEISYISNYIQPSLYKMTQSSHKVLTPIIIDDIKTNRKEYYKNGKLDINKVVSKYGISKDDAMLILRSL